MIPLQGQGDEEARRRTGIPPAVRLYLYAFWVLSVFAAGILTSDRFIFHKTFVYWYPLFYPNIAGTDFSIFQDRFGSLHTIGFFRNPGFPFTYPAPDAFIFGAFFRIPSHTEIYFIGVCALAFLGATLLFSNSLLKLGLTAAATCWIVLPTALLGYPEWFLLNRGNIEAFCWMGTALGVWAYWHRRWYTASVLFGLAAALKLFPFILLALLLSAKKYAALAMGVAVMIGTTVLSTYWVGPSYGEASRGVAAGLEAFRQGYVLTRLPNNIGFDHSLFVWVKLLEGRGLFARNNAFALSLYMACVSLGGLLLYWFRIRTLPRVNQIVALLTCMVLLPPVSFEYTLVHLYIAWAVLVLFSVGWHSERQNAPSGLVPAMVAMAWLLSCQTYLLILSHEAPLRIAGPIKGLVLAAFLGMTLWYPWREASPRPGDRPPR